MEKQPSLARDREVQGIAAAAAGSEAYFARARVTGEPPTMAGLKAAVREAVVATLGPPPAKRPRPAPKAISAEYRAWSNWTAAVEELGRADADIAALAAYRPGYLPELLAEAERAAPGLLAWRDALRRIHADALAEADLSR